MDKLQSSVISICGNAGSLHLHTPPQATPHTTHANHRIRAQTSTTLLTAYNRLLSLVHTQNSSHILLQPLPPLTAPPRKLSPPDQTLTCIASSPTSYLLAAGTKEGRCFLWNVLSGNLVSVWNAHFRAVLNIRFSDDEEALITASEDASVHIFSIASLATEETPSPFASLKAHTLPVCALSVGFAGASSRIVTASADRTARVWHMSSATLLTTIMLPCRVVDVLMTHDESLIYIGVADGRVFSAETASLPMGVLSWKTLRQFAAVDGEPTVTCMALWMNDLCVAYGDGVVRFYDGFSGVMTRSYTKHNTTAAIDALHVIDASKISEQEVTLFPDGLGRVRKYAHELAQEEETDMVPIEMCTGKKVGDVAWNLVDDAMEEVFSVQTSVQISLGDREKALAEEVEILRRRNVELEAAGRRLIQLVEKDNG